MTDRTVRLTVAQAVVTYLSRQYSVADGQRRRLIPATLGIFGHGNVADDAQGGGDQAAALAGGPRGLPGQGGHDGLGDGQPHGLLGHCRSPFFTRAGRAG